MVEDQDMTLEDDAGAESESERSSSSCSFDMEKILEVVAKIQEKKNEFPTGMVGTGKSLPITTKMDLPDTSGKLPKVSTTSTTNRIKEIPKISDKAIVFPEICSTIVSDLVQLVDM